MKDNQTVNKALKYLFVNAQVVSLNYSGIFTIKFNLSAKLIGQKVPQELCIDIMTDWYLDSKSHSKENFENMTSDRYLSYKSSSFINLYGKTVTSIELNNDLSLTIEFDSKATLSIPSKDEHWNDLWDLSWDIYNSENRDFLSIVCDSGIELNSNIPIEILEKLE